MGCSGRWGKGSARRWRAQSWVILATLGAAALAAACNEASESDAHPIGGGTTRSSGEGTNGDIGVDSPDPNEPEVELEESFRAPVVSGKYLWSANPDTNQVARIHAGLLEIEVFEGGHAPTYLAALPEGATSGGALVLNELSNDASVLLIDEQGQLLSNDRYPVQLGASAWTVGEKGNYALAWSRAEEDLLNQADGYQDLTVFDFTGDEVQTVTLSVGFRPTRVTINEAETHAYVVSAPGISVIDLASGGAVEREIFLPDDTTSQPRDVVFTPDGRLAMVRLGGSAEILLIDTVSDERRTVVLNGPVTDLDLSADGSTAVAVVRGGQSENLGVGGQGGSGAVGGPENSVISLLPVDTIFDDPTGFEQVVTSEIVGSAVVAEDASQVLLFTNATVNHHLTLLRTEDSSLRVVDLKAPVRAAFLAEDAAHAVALMLPPEGSQKLGAFALVPVEKALSPRIEGTTTVPEFVTISAAAGRALVTTRATPSTPASTYFAHFPGLQVDRFELSNRALASGLVPDAGQAFVAEEHPEGRVSFINLDSGQKKTVTGYELAGKVVQ